MALLQKSGPKASAYFPFPKLSDTLICGVVLAILLLKLVLKAVMSWHRKDTFFGTPFPWQTEGDSCWAGPPVVVDGTLKAVKGKSLSFLNRQDTVDRAMPGELMTPEFSDSHDSVCGMYSVWTCTLAHLRADTLRKHLLNVIAIPKKNSILW